MNMNNSARPTYAGLKVFGCCAECAWDAKSQLQATARRSCATLEPASLFAACCLESAAICVKHIFRYFSNRPGPQSLSQISEE